VLLSNVRPALIREAYGGAVLGSNGINHRWVSIADAARKETQVQAPVRPWPDRKAPGALKQQPFVALPTNRAAVYPLPHRPPAMLS
jgi:hypothetical protein